VINLTGIGRAPEIEVQGGSGFTEDIVDGSTSSRIADGTDFGELGRFASNKSTMFRIRNSGNINLTLTNISISGDSEFSLDFLPPPAFPLPALGSRDFIVTFSPGALGSKEATVTIVNDDPDEALFTFIVSAEVTANPDIELQGRSGTLPLSNIPNGTTTPILPNGTLFENTSVGGENRHNFRVQNFGTAVLEYRASIASDQFRITGNNSGTVLIGSEGQLGNNLFINFQPTSPGLHEATVSIESDDPDENPYTFLIRGLAIAPKITVLGNGVEIENGDDTPRVGDGTDFLGVEVSAGNEFRTFQIKNDGDEILTFLSAVIEAESGFFLRNLPEANFPIPPKGFEEFDVGFNPSTDGVVTGRISIITTDSTNTPFTFEVQAEGLGNPRFSLRTDPGDDVIIPNQRIEFRETELGETSSSSFIIKNEGDGTLTYVENSSNSEFEISKLGSDSNPRSEDGFSIEPRIEDEFLITFNPGSRGEKAAVITFNTNDSEASTFSFIVEGRAVDPEMDLFGGPMLNEVIKNNDDTPSINNGTSFNPSIVGAPGQTNTYKIFNSGERDLVIASQFPDLGEHFTVTGLPNAISPIEPNTGVDFQITFEPQSKGLKTATLQIINSDHNENPYTFTISGEGINGPEFDLKGGPDQNVDILSGASNPSLTNGTDFDSIEIGESKTSTFTISNTGNEELVLGSTTISAGQGFTLSMPPIGPISAQGEATFTITFTPESAGIKSAIVTIASNDDDESPYEFAISGKGKEEPSSDPPSFNSFTLDGTDGLFTFDTIPGVTYRLMFNSTLSGDWVPVSIPAVLGNGSVNTMEVEGLVEDGVPKGFYRIETTSSQ